MKPVSTLATRIRRNEPLPAPLGALLYAASFAQRLGMWSRLHRGRTQVPVRVISFGNLTAGGTGKTPAVIERVLREQQAGHKVAVLTRGYGAAYTRNPLVLRPDDETARNPGIFGDEAILIARCAPGVWIVRCADRVAGARAALEEGCEVLILDDGFQAVQLVRDENILLIDATNPFGNGYVLPRGILREPVAALGRATEVIVTRCDQAPEALSGIEAAVRRISPGIPIRFCVHQPVALRRVKDGAEFPLIMLQGAEVRVICGIGNPESFMRTLETMGALIKETHILADHAPIPEAFLEGEYLTMLTEKDAMRTGIVGANVYALGVALGSYR